MTPADKKELEFILKQGTKILIGMAILAVTLLILANTIL
jgi:hypothetical protein